MAEVDNKIPVTTEQTNTLSNSSEQNKLSTVKPNQIAALTVNTADLKQESLEIINKIIAESDADKTQDLTNLFNVNQAKKNLVRVNKLNELLDVITDQAVTRFATKPDEISNKELIDGLKTVQDLIERGQDRAASSNEQPFIQINQQNNSVNVGPEGSNLSRDSREKVKNAVMGLLSSLTANNKDTSKPIDNETVDADFSSAATKKEESTEVTEELLVEDESK